MSLGEKIRERRKKTALSQEQLADTKKNTDVLIGMFLGFLIIGNILNCILN